MKKCIGYYHKLIQLIIPVSFFHVVTLYVHTYIRKKILTQSTFEMIYKSHRRNHKNKHYAVRFALVI